MNFKLIAITIPSCSLVCVGICQTDIKPRSSYSQRTYESAAWETLSNGIQFGARIASVGRTSADRFKIFTFLYNPGTSNVVGLWKLEEGYRIDMKLEGKDGKLIDVTSAGERFCRYPDGRVIMKGRVVVLPPKEPFNYDESFDLRDCFNLKKPGEYVFSIKPRLYVLRGYPKIEPIEAPYLRIPVYLRDSDWKN